MSPHEEEGDEDDDEEVSTKTQVLAEGQIEELTLANQTVSCPELTLQCITDQNCSEATKDVRVQGETEAEAGTLSMTTSDFTVDQGNSSAGEEEEHEGMGDDAKEDAKQDHTTSSGAASSENLLDGDIGTFSEPELESYQVWLHQV